MFTGIVESVAKVSFIKAFESMSTVGILTKVKFNDSNIGDSVSINGACLTISKIKDKICFFDIVSETLDKTNLSALKAGDYVNMERAMRVSDRLNGHLVQGHIDGLSRIELLELNKNETTLKIKLNEKLLRYCVYKGSICIDGISLTIAGITDDIIELAIIPHTFNNTILKYKKVNDLINIEIDIISKYVSKMVKEMDVK